MTHHEVYKAYAINEILEKEWTLKTQGLFSVFHLQLSFKSNFDPFVEIVHLLPTSLCPSKSTWHSWAVCFASLLEKRVLKEIFLLLIPSSFC